MGSSCNAAKKNTLAKFNLKNIKDVGSKSDRLIMFDIEYENTKINNNFSSNSTIKEIKQSLRKRMISNKSRDNILIKIYINGKEIKDENCIIGEIIEGDRADLYLACLTLTDEIVKDEKKFFENLIKNLSKSCSVHSTNKALNLCLTCSDSHCDVCIPDHQNHKIVCKKEIINYEQNLLDLKTFIKEKFIDMGIPTYTDNTNTYQEFLKNLRSDISKQCENLMKLIEEIKKKEIQLMNNFKMEIDLTFPSILDYRDKIEDLTLQVTENKREKIIRNDSEFIDFYLKYTQLNNVTEKSKQNILTIKKIVDKYKEIINDFKLRNELISKTLHDNIDKIRNYDITYGIPYANSAFGTSMKNDRNYLNSHPNIVNVNNSFNMINFNTNQKNDIIKPENNLNLNQFNSNNNERGRAMTNINNLNILNNNFESNVKQQNELVNSNNSINAINFNSSGKLNLINLLGSNGKNKNNLIRSINRLSVSKSPPHLDQSIKNQTHLNNNQNPNKSQKSFHNIVVEEQSPIKLLNEQREEALILQTKIYSMQISTKNIFVFDNSTNTIKKHEVDLTDSGISKFESNQSSINFANKFYITGGGFYSSKNFFELDPETLKLKRLCDMLFKHTYHTLLGANNSIFAISGFNSKKCEKFEIKIQNWTELPDLNEPRSFPNCVFLENKFIYVFGGYFENLSKSNLAIERINLQGNNNWEKFEINLNLENINDFPFYSGIIRTSTDKFLLLGGKLNKDSDPLDNVYDINLKDNSIQSFSDLKLPNADEFQGKMFLKYDSNKFGLFSSINSNKFYIYDENENNFELKEFKD